MILTMLNMNDKVKDTWFQEWGVGVVVKAFKTVCYINFSNKGVVKYDNPHLKFLKKIK